MFIKSKKRHAPDRDEVARETAKAQIEVEAAKEEAVEASEKLAVKMGTLQAQVHKLLKFSTFEPRHKHWLDTGSPDLNAVFGSREKGIPYGKIFEVGGEEHGGKTTLTMIIAALAQKDGAAIGRIDLEESIDEDWDRKMGLDPSNIYNISPRLVVPRSTEDADEKPKSKKKKKGGAVKGVPRLQSAEELFKEAETAMAMIAAAGIKKQFWYIDSVANIQTEMAVDAGTDRNMRVNLDRAMFLSQTLPMLASLAANYSASIFLINQLRDRPNVMFGDPTYTPGGRALRHACSIRVRVRRAGKGGTVKLGDEVIGLRGSIKNIKNKAGAGSKQNEGCAFKIRWNKELVRTTFVAPSEGDDL